MTNLSITPQCSEMMLNKHRAESILFRSKIPFLTVQHGGHLVGLIVVYSHSSFINRVSNATEGEMTLLARVLDPDSGGVVDTTRS